jgi:hypothetical protein
MEETMAFIKFALTAENEVFHICVLDEERTTAQKWIAAFRSEVKITCSTGYDDVHQGWTYLNNNFYTPDDITMQFPCTKTIIDNPETHRYAGIINGEVIGFMTFIKPELPEGIFDMIHAGMQSNPVSIEFPDHSSVNIGDIWDGNGFTTPLVN